MSEWNQFHGAPHHQGCGSGFISTGPDPTLEKKKPGSISYLGELPDPDPTFKKKRIQFQARPDKINFFLQKLFYSLEAHGSDPREKKTRILIRPWRNTGSRSDRREKKAVSSSDRREIPDSDPTFKKNRIRIQARPDKIIFFSKWNYSLEAHGSVSDQNTRIQLRPKHPDPDPQQCCQPPFYV